MEHFEPAMCKVPQQHRDIQSENALKNPPWGSRERRRGVALDRTIHAWQHSPHKELCAQHGGARQGDTTNISSEMEMKAESPRDGSPAVLVTPHTCCLSC